MASDHVHIGWIREDRAHDDLVKTLARKVAIEAHDWLDGILEYCWSWAGPNHEAEPKLTRIEVRRSGGQPVRFHSRIGEQPLRPEAAMYRSILLEFKKREPRPDIVIIARDGDHDAARRRSGFEQVNNGLDWPFDVVLAMPEPESETWFILGFEPASEIERDRLDAVKLDISFDPTKQPHRTTSRPNAASTDAKRILNRLIDGDQDRKASCLDHSLDSLVERGTSVGLEQFITDLRATLPAHFARSRSQSGPANNEA